MLRTQDGGRQLGNDLAQFRCQAIRAQQPAPLLCMANGGPGLPLAWTGLAGLAQTLALAAFLIAELPLNNSLPAVMFCNALLLAFHCPAQVNIIKSEIKVVGVLFGLVSLHVDLLSGLEHHQPKKTRSIGVLWVLHLLNVTIKQCLGNAEWKRTYKERESVCNYYKKFKLTKQSACSKALLPPHLATMTTFGVTMSFLCNDSTLF